MKAFNFKYKVVTLIFEDISHMYSVKRSDWNRYFDDVVLDSVNRAFRDEDNNFERIYAK